MVGTEEIRDALREVYDPEIPVNIVDLGLVYDIELDEDTGDAHIEMTLTSMGCPIADSITRNVRVAAESVEGVESATVELVWDPPWSPAKASEDGKAQLQSLGIRVPDDGEESDEEATVGGPTSNAPF
ncbi:MAG: metal-sulfur cluster assembly factor [Halodesulfurarchaeum sp.]